ncbi:MAG: heat-inducible transcriptional repressor HrcA [Candidatus Omnitrophica bacterium]|nr:heat-inducible transcriptional repressor HrcA [Candidatus Omnitrophota bacterium]
MLQDMNERREAVLALIISHYIDTAEPVSSRYVAKKLNLSSATVRNVMADLEDLGLISQPHTSAGRIPTDKGYRYYIDSLMRVRRINEHIVNVIREQYNQAMLSFEDVLEKTSHLISSLTRYVGVTLFPQSEKVYLDGASYIVEQPEFKDFKKLYNLLRCLEEKANIVNLLRSDLGDSLVIHIGKENRSSYLNECSVVTRGYRVKGKPAGRLGVIGPKRMVYEKVIPTVEILADTVTRILDELTV